VGEEIFYSKGAMDNVGVRVLEFSYKVFMGNFEIIFGKKTQKDFLAKTCIHINVRFAKFCNE
jgi:hypothetical protein